MRGRAACAGHIAIVNDCPASAGMGIKPDGTSTRRNSAGNSTHATSSRCRTAPLPASRFQLLPLAQVMSGF